MKLIRLYANKESFHTIEFNRSGISLIAAHRKKSGTGDTYNSVGKSLSIYLIHFCLGVKVTSDFKRKLSGWVFNLDFEHLGSLHTASRSVDDPATVTYDGNTMPASIFTKQLGREVFNLDSNEGNPSFRALICRFIRQGAAGYVKYNKFKEKEPDYDALINTAYLLGLDINLAKAKKITKGQLDNVKKQRKLLTEDDVVHDLLTSGMSTKDIDIKLLDLERLIEKLKSDLENFVVTEDYTEIKQEADAISEKLFRLRNQATQYTIALQNISMSMQECPDITPDILQSLYEETKLFFGDQVKKRISDVEKFNHMLLDDRIRILAQEKIEYQSKLDAVRQDIAHIEKAENEKLQFLNSHGALDDFVKLSSRLSDSETQKSKLSQFKNMQKNYKQKQEELVRKLQEANIRTQEYLDSIEKLIKQHLTVFHDLALRFYTDKSAGLVIANNENENMFRYTIDARISDDNGDGVNEVKLFCFDWTLLKAQKNHNVEFIVHDSRIISDTDPRQIATLIRTADKECQGNGFQYILTINEASIDLVKSELGNDFERLVGQNEILVLDDKSPESKLLGIQVDLQYE